MTPRARIRDTIRCGQTVDFQYGRNSGEERACPRVARLPANIGRAGLHATCSDGRPCTYLIGFTGQVQSRLVEELLHPGLVRFSICSTSRLNGTGTLSFIASPLPRQMNEIEARTLLDTPDA
jgi:hypothetical protein